MSRDRTSLRKVLRLRHLALPTAAAAIFATLQLGQGPLTQAPLGQAAVPGSAAGYGAASQWTPLNTASVSFTTALDQASSAPVSTMELLAFNDLHGAIDPPAGSGGLINGVPVGGADYLSGTIKRLRAQYLPSRDRVITVAAGDNIGASPLISAAFHDEPTIEIENALGLDVTSVGNHEFDEGVNELLRIQNGGCHPVDGCADGDPYLGAAFPFLAANVVDKVTRVPILPPYVIEKVHGVKVAFIGETLTGTASIVNPAGIANVDFLDEAATANFYRRQLAAEEGINAFVLLIHQGGTQNSPPTPLDPSGCANFVGDITPIVSKLDPEFGVVISGHTHRFYTCTLPNRAGNSLVTSAGANGVLVTDVSATLNRATKRFVSAAAHNVLVENSVRNPDGTFTRDPSKADPVATQIADKYRVAIAPIANRVVGSITADITNANNPAGESALGDVIADAQLGYTTSASAQVALMNPGGIRASLIYANSPGGEAPGEVTYGEAFTVQPFNNLVVTQTFTGQQLKDVLEQQFGGCFGQVAGGRVLQPSASLTYTWSTSAPCGSKVTNLQISGVPVDLAASYRVTTNDFLANGGDGFTRLTAGTGRVTAPGFDIDALTAYLGAHSPVPPGPQNRVTVAP
jgi:5'-nucleotidase